MHDYQLSKIFSNLKCRYNKIRQQQNQVKGRSIKPYENKLNASSLSILYTSWTSLPTEQKGEYKYLQEQFRQNYSQIRTVLRPKSKARLKVAEKPNFIDLREKLKATRHSLANSNSEPAINKFLKCIKISIQDTTYKTLSKKSFGSTLKNEIFESYIKRDEPFRALNEVEMNKIPFKELLLVQNVVGEIFVSGIRASADPSLMIKNSIKGVVSIGNCKKCPRFGSVSMGYLEVDIIENQNKLQGIKENLAKIMKFMDNCLKKGNVLICCYYGCCRSCLVVCAYLIIKYRIRINKAYTIVKKGRKFCDFSQVALNSLGDLENYIFTPQN